MFAVAFIARFLGPVAFAFGQVAHAASNEPYVQGVVVDAEQAVITLYGTSLAGRTYMKLGLNGHSQLLEVIDRRAGSRRASRRASRPGATCCGFWE